MLNFVEYLAMKKANPDDKCYLERIVFEIPETNKAVSFWNGYELERIFGLEVPDLREIFSEEEWCRIIKRVKESRFWENNWKYGEAITAALRNEGIELQNKCRSHIENRQYSKVMGIRKKFFEETVPGAWLRLHIKNRNKAYFTNVHANPEQLFLHSNENIYCGQTLLFMENGNHIEDLDKEIREAFRFPPIRDVRNKQLLEEIHSTNAVAVHVRRGDSLNFANGKNFKTGYYKRAVKYIKKHVENPVFYIFSDPDTSQWCKMNLKHLCLCNHKDQIVFVDWNAGEESFRDMQLMSECKHNVYSWSSFGWWAGYLNNNPNKITCSPVYTVNSTHHF